MYHEEKKSSFYYSLEIYNHFFVGPVSGVEIALMNVFFEKSDVFFSKIDDSNRGKDDMILFDCVSAFLATAGVVPAKPVFGSVLEDEKNQFLLLTMTLLKVIFFT